VVVAWCKEVSSDGDRGPTEAERTRWRVRLRENVPDVEKRAVGARGAGADENANAVVRQAARYEQQTSEVQRARAVRSKQSHIERVWRPSSPPVVQAGTAASVNASIYSALHVKPRAARNRYAASARARQPCCSVRRVLSCKPRSRYRALLHSADCPVLRSSANHVPLPTGSSWYRRQRGGALSCWAQCMRPQRRQVVREE